MVLLHKEDERYTLKNWMRALLQERKTWNMALDKGTLPTKSARWFPVNIRNIMLHDNVTFSIPNKISVRPLLKKFNEKV